jgi:hypothetical protein
MQIFSCRLDSELPALRAHPGLDFYYYRRASGGPGKYFYIARSMAWQPAASAGQRSGKIERQWQTQSYFASKNGRLVCR